MSDRPATRPLHFWAAIAISLAGYWLLFTHGVHKPQTIGTTHRLFELKDARLAALKDVQKLVILAGSNGRMSHSARVIEEITGVPAVNMSVSAGFAIDIQLERIKPMLRAGDWMYLPLEYGELTRDAKAVYTDASVPYMVAYEPDVLAALPPERRLRAAFYFDLPFLFSALAEMGLQAAGYERRITVKDFNAWGDHIDHTPAKAAPYRGHVMRSKADPGPVVVADSFSARAVSAFLDWARERGVTVVGGYPVYAEGVPIDPQADARLQEFFTSRGHRFLALANKGRYPRRLFFDSVHHLCEPYQAEHSMLVGEALREMLAADRRGGALQ